MGDMQRDLVESQKLLERIQTVMNGRGRVGIFPDLASQRTKSTEMMNQLVGTRQKFAGKIRAIIDPVLTPEESKELDRIAIERDGIERQLSAMPTTDEGVLAHERTMKERFAEIDRQASELNVEIQAMEAQLVAIENYYRVSRSEQKIRPEDIRQPVRDMRTTIEELRGLHEKLREAIADARRDATAAGGIGEVERETTKKLTEALQRELGIEKRAMGRLSGNDRVQVERMVDLLGRCDAIETQLYAFDKRIDAQVTNRLDDRQSVPGGREGGAGARLGQAGQHHGGVEEHGRRPRAGDVHQGGRQVLRSRRPLRRRHHRRVVGPQGSEDQRGHPAHQPEEPGAQGAGRGLPQGAGGGQVIRPSRALLLWTLTMLGAGAGALPASAAPPPAARRRRRRRRRSRRAPPDPRLLDEMEKDVQRFAQMVTEYRATARDILKREYHNKAKAINAKYDPQIDLNDREARDRRRDAIAMFEAFLLRYPNDKRWTPDAMFRLAELYYEKSAEEYLDADEAYKKALDTPNPPDTPPPRVDYTPTINLYRRLLTEFPSYRFLDAAYYLLGFCLGEMGEEQQAKQALLALVCSNRFKPLDTPVPTPKPAPRAPGAPPAATRSSTRSARRSVRSRSSFPRRGRASASSTSTTRTSCGSRSPPSARC